MKFVCSFFSAFFSLFGARAKFQWQRWRLLYFLLYRHKCFPRTTNLQRTSSNRKVIIMCRFIPYSFVTNIGGLYTERRMILSFSFELDIFFAIGQGERLSHENSDYWHGCLIELALEKKILSKGTHKRIMFRTSDTVCSSQRLTEYRVSFCLWCVCVFGKVYWFYSHTVSSKSSVFQACGKNKFVNSLKNIKISTLIIHKIFGLFLTIIDEQSE